MRSYLQALSPRTEFYIVVLGAFGYFILGFVGSFIPGISEPADESLITEADLTSLLIYEPVILVTLWKFLSLRGWTLRDLGLSPTIGDTAMGLILAITVYYAYAVLYVFLDPPTDSVGTAVFGLATIIAVSIINPVFEEVFVAGYVISALKSRRGFWTAINISVFIRLLYHLYQGPLGVISIIPMGLIFGYVYAKSGRLWPLIVGHAALDFYALIYYPAP